MVPFMRVAEGGVVPVAVRGNGCNGLPQRSPLVRLGFPYDQLSECIVLFSFYRVPELPEIMCILVCRTR